MLRIAGFILGLTGLWYLTTLLPDDREAERMHTLVNIAINGDRKIEAAPASTDQPPPTQKALNQPDKIIAVPAQPLPHTPVTHVAGGTVEQSSTVTHNIANAVQAPPIRNPLSLARSKPVTRQIARDVQRELKRLGCYHGRIDGIWGSASKQALSQLVKQTKKPLAAVHPGKELLTILKEPDAPACRRG